MTNFINNTEVEILDKNLFEELLKTRQYINTVTQEYDLDNKLVIKSEGEYKGKNICIKITINKQDNSEGWLEDYVDSFDSIINHINGVEDVLEDY